MESSLCLNKNKGEYSKKMGHLFRNFMDDPDEPWTFLTVLISYTNNEEEATELLDKLRRVTIEIKEDQNHNKGPSS